MKHYLKVLFALALVFGLSSCATVFKGGTEDVFVNSDPTGAEVLINGVSYGVTPVTLNLDSNQDYTLVLRQGGQEETFFINSEIGTLWIVLDVLTGLVPIIVDAATGDWYELSPNEVFVSFN